MESPNIRETDVSNHSLRNTRNSQRLQSSLFEVSKNTNGSHSFLQHKTPKSVFQGSSSLANLGNQSRNLNESITILSPNHLQREFITESLTGTQSHYYAEEDPGQQACFGMFSDFFAIYQKYNSQFQVFDLLLRYEKKCSDLVALLQKIVKKDPSSRQKFSKTGQLLRLLTTERDSWRLLRTLTQDRLETMQTEDEFMEFDDESKYVSDKRLMEELFKRNSHVRQGQLVLDWLEQNNLDELNSKQPLNMDQHCDPWENTLYYLQLKSKGLEYSSKKNLITSLDPDAPLRQSGMVLHDTDKEDQEKLFKYMFIQIRAGQLNNAQSMAIKYGFPWLAAILEGWKLHHDPNYELRLVEGEAVQHLEGNPYRDVWKSAVWTASSQGKLGQFEKALYGAFSGNLQAILPVCVTWDDHMWAYLRVMVDILMEQELRNLTSSKRPLLGMPLTYWEKGLSLAEIFTELDALPQLQAEGQEHHHIVQKLVVLNDFDSLVTEMSKWASDGSLSSHLSRFMAHITLFLRTINYHINQEKANTILVAYIKSLMKEQDNYLVAHYTATLSPDLQVHWYAKFLEDVTDKEEREDCLEKAKEAGLDVTKITKTVVENIRHRESTDPMDQSSLSPETTELDNLKIEAIDWLIFDVSQRSEAIRQANALMRSLLASNKLDAARRVFAKIPPDSIDLIVRKHKELTGSMDLESEEENITKEYMCFQAYLVALDAFNDWFQCFHHGKPQEPIEPSTGNTQYTEWLAYEHRQKQFESDLERWTQTLEALTKSTSQKMYNVLLFYNGGWMVDSIGSLEEELTPEEIGRQTQLSLLRKLYIPKLTLLLHSVLDSSGLHQEAVKLADIVASETYNLYKEFGPQELTTFLAKVRESSLVLLDQNLDPLGYAS